MAVKPLNIMNRKYYFYNDMTNVLNFMPINLKLDKKKHGKTLIFIILVMLIKINQQIGV